MNFWSVKVLVEWTLNGETNLSGFIKNIFISGSKMNKRFMGLNDMKVKNFILGDLSH